MTKARHKRDMEDTLVILTTLADRSPFAPDPNFRNIMAGVNAGKAVNVDRAIKATGERIMPSINDWKDNWRLHV